MKNSVLASLLFGAIAVAAPMNKRDLVYKTEVLTETVIVYTTVWDGDAVAEATTTPAGYFYEQPSSSSVATTSSPAAAPAQPSAPAPAPSSAQQPATSAYVAPPAPQAQAPTPAPAPSPSPAPAPQPQPAAQSPQAVEQPAQPATSAYVAPAAASPAPAPTTQAASPAPAPAPSPAAASPAASNGGGSASGDTYTNVDMTIYDNNGGFGACGTELHDSDMIVALAKDAWGASTYDVQTGAATNPWCGQKIKIDYNGNSIQATIMDLCPGCSGHDIDLSLAAWTQLTGLTEKTRLKASWSKV